MTDDQLLALRAVLDVAHSTNRQVTPHVLKQAAAAVASLLDARKYFRMVHGQHEDRCNSIMGWNDTTCDCPYAAFKRALLGEDPDEHPMTGAL